MMKSRAGMTLMELLVVVIIMAILACMILPKFSGHSERAAVSEAVQALSAIRQAEEAYRLDNLNVYTSTLADLDVDLVQTNFTYGVAAAAGPTFTATATRQNTGSTPCTNKTITLTNAGVFGGTHPFGPNPVAGAACS